MRKTGDQLGAEPLPLSKIRDGSAESVTDVPVALPSSIFDFVPGTPPSWSWKVYVLHRRTLYGFIE